MKMTKEKFFIARIRKPNRIHIFLQHHGEPYQFDDIGEAHEVLLSEREKYRKHLPELKVVKVQIFEDD